eukprot:5645248-Pyramimonas_sp.AAC.1
MKVAHAASPKPCSKSACGTVAVAAASALENLLGGKEDNVDFAIWVVAAQDIAAHDKEPLTAPSGTAPSVAEICGPIDCGSMCSLPCGAL